MRVGKNIKKFISVLLIVSFLFMCVPFSHLKNVEANNIVLDGHIRQPNHGRNYWQTSNLREWLNSAEETVNYTCNSPSRERLGNNAYDSEPGFLSEFTPEEQNAITVTEHRVFIAQCDVSVKDGGTQRLSWGDYPSPLVTFSCHRILSIWQNYYYQNVKDKVYILNVYELYNFVQKRGNTIEKGVTNAARQKYNYYNNNIGYWLASALNSCNGDWISIVSGKTLTSVSGTGICSPQGVVPVINLKPDYILSNGKQAKDLSIDEIVIFGRYLGEPIEWRVVNIQDGYPMLLAEKAVSIKAYDAPGDPALAYSEYIDFSNEPYIDRTNPIYTAKDKHSDVESPRFTFQNEDELWERQNDEFTLSLRVEDNSIIEGIILPDGRQLNPNNTETEFEYTVTGNGNFLFTAWDTHKNYRLYMVPIGNVNVPATVMIKPSADGWTNKDVDVDIDVTNNVGYEVVERIQNTRDACGPYWTNYTSYTGKRIRISGDVELIKADEPVGDVSITAGVNHLYTGVDQNGFYMGSSCRSPERYTLKDLQDNGKKHFDIIYTVPGNYHSNFRPWFQIGVPSFNRAYTIKWTNIKYELLDNDDLKIEKITLPTGEEIFGQSSYTDTLTEEGEYLYTVLDSRGLIYNRTVRVWIDKIRPTINITADKNHLTKEVVLTATAEDDRSGIDRIVLPNNSTVAGNGNNRIEVPYNVIANGSYTFKVYDRAGNYAEKKVTVNNILDLIVAYFDSNPAVSFPVSIRTGGTSQLIITAFYAGCPCGDITKEADCISSNPDIVEIITGEDGKKTVHGKSKGDAVITINYEGITASIPIEVRPKLYLYIRTLQ
jgi:hypothetical protein